MNPEQTLAIFFLLMSTNLSFTMEVSLQTYGDKKNKNKQQQKQIKLFISLHTCTLVSDNIRTCFFRKGVTVIDNLHLKNENINFKSKYD